MINLLTRNGRLRSKFVSVRAGRKETGRGVGSPGYGGGWNARCQVVSVSSREPREALEASKPERVANGERSREITVDDREPRRKQRDPSSDRGRIDVPRPVPGEYRDSGSRTSFPSKRRLPIFGERPSSKSHSTRFRWRNGREVESSGDTSKRLRALVARAIDIRSS